MEQNNSIRNELNQLIALQSQQLGLLTQLNTSQQRNTNLIAQQQANAQQINAQAQNPNFNSAYMYQQAQQYTPNPYLQQDAYMQQMGYSAVSSLKKPTKESFGLGDMFTPESAWGTKTRTMVGLDVGSRVGQSAIFGLGALGSMGLNYGMDFLPLGLKANLAVGMLGGGLISAATAIGADEAKKQDAYEKYIYKNSYRFINAGESNNTREGVGFTLKESQKAATYIRELTNDMYFRDSEMMAMTQKFTEGGLLKETKDLESFKNKMKTLSKTVKQGAFLLDETYEDIASLMNDMKKLGINEKYYDDHFASNKLIANRTESGATGGDNLRNNITYVINQNQSTGASNEKLLTRVEDTELYLANYFNKIEGKPSRTPLEESNYNMVKNLGGVEKASQVIQTQMEEMVKNQYIRNAGAVFFDFDKSSNDFVFNNEKFKNFLKDKKPISAIMDEASDKLNKLQEAGFGAAIEKFQSNASLYLKNNFSNGDMTDFITRIMDSFLRDPAAAEHGSTPRELLKYFGVKNTDLQNLMSGFLTDRAVTGPNYAKDVRLQAMWLDNVSAAQTEMPTIAEAWRSAWGKFKTKIGSPFVNASDTVKRALLEYTDKWHEYEKKAGDPIDKYFTIRTGINSISPESFQKELEKTSNLIASSFEGINILQKKGYNIDKTLENFVKDTYNNSDKTVHYDREVIKNWKDVNDNLKSSQDYIIDEAKKHSLSETIVAALMQYNQNVGGKDKLNLQETINNLGSNNFAYGGNTKLALGATLIGSDEMDSYLKGIGININNLRSTGSQDTLTNVKLEDLGLPKEILEKIDRILSQELGAPSTPNNQGGGEKQGGGEGNEEGNKDSSNAWDRYGATQGENGQMIKDIALKAGLNPAELAAVAVTENETGDMGLVSSAGAVGPLQIMPEAADEFGRKYGVKGFLTGKEYTGFEQIKTDREMNLSIGAAYQKKAEEIFGENPIVKYMSYNFGIGGWKNILNSAGITTKEEMAGLNYNDIKNLMMSTGVEASAFQTLDRIVDKLKEFGVVDDKGNHVKGGGKDGGPSDGGEGNNSGNTTPSGNKRIETGKEQIYKDVYGNPAVDKNGVELTEEQINKMNEIQKGFNVNKTLSERQLDFITKFDFINTQPKDQEKTLDETIKGFTSGGHRFGVGNIDFDDNIKMMLVSYTEAVKAIINKNSGDGQYRNVDELVNKNMDARNLRDDILEKLDKSGNPASKEVMDKVNALLELQLEGKGPGNGKDDKPRSDEELKEENKRRTIRQFGASMGISLEQYGGDVVKYNSALYNSANNFYNQNKEALLDFVNHRDTKAASNWSNMDATQKVTTLKMLERLEQVFSENGDKYNTGNKNIDTVKELADLLRAGNQGKGKEETGNEVAPEKNIIFNDKDKEKMKYLHKVRDKYGNVKEIVYNPYEETKDEINEETLMGWIQGGSKVDKYGKLKHKIADAGLSSEDSYNELIRKTHNAFDVSKDRTLQEVEQASKQFESLSPSLKKQLGDDEFEHISKVFKSGDYEQFNKLVEQLDKQNQDNANRRKELIDQGYDEEDLPKVLDLKDLKEFSKLVENISKTDPSHLQDLLIGLQKGQDLMKDLGNSLKFTEAALGDSYSVFLESSMEDVIKNTIDGLSKDDKTKGKIQLAMSSGSVGVEEFIEALQNGGVLNDKNGNQVVELSVETMTKLLDGLSESMYDSMKKALTGDHGNDTIDKLTGNKDLMEEMTKYDKDIGNKLSELSKANQAVETSVGDAKQKAIDHAKELADTIMPTIQKATVDAAKKADESAKGIDKLGSDFAGALGKYDKSIQEAIGILNGRINSGWGVNRGTNVSSGQRRRGIVGWLS